MISGEDDTDEKMDSIAQSEEHIKKPHEDETVDETLDEGIFSSFCVFALGMNGIPLDLGNSNYGNENDFENTCKKELLTSI